MTATREWERTDNGVWYPGATLGHTEPVKPSQGGLRYEAFCANHIRQSKGRWRKKPLHFYPQQSGFHHELFRTENGRRLYNEALYGVPRKNGKSTDVAALALYLLLADGEPAPEVYGAAGSRQQARIIFTEARRMVEASPVLSEWCKCYRNEIVVPSIDGVYRAVSADGGLNMGANPSAVVGDEMHVWKGDAGRELYYAFITAMDARENPLAIWLTTAGYELDSICREVYDRMLSGSTDELNPYSEEGRSLMWWLGALEGQDTNDPAVWLAANPAPWITEARLGNRFHKLPRPVFERLHLNLWTTTQQLWLPDGAWAALKSGAKIQPGEQVWLGIDIGFARDCSAVVMVARRDGEGPNGTPLYVAEARIFDPARQMDGRLDLSPVENYVRKLRDTYTVVEARYDRTLFQRSAEDLSETVRMVEFAWASNQQVVEASQALYELIVEHGITWNPDHPDAGEFGRHVNAAVIRETESGYRISKHKSKRRIDALAALLMALKGAVGKRKAEPGARPIETGTGRKVKAPAKDKLLEHPLAKRAIEKARAGGVVECSKDEYEKIVRPALSLYAGLCQEEGDELRMRVATAELRRLDAVHGRAGG